MTYICELTWNKSWLWQIFMVMFVVGIFIYCIEYTISWIEYIQVKVEISLKKRSKSRNLNGYWIIILVAKEEGNKVCVYDTMIKYKWEKYHGYAIVSLTIKIPKKKKTIKNI